MGKLIIADVNELESRIAVLLDGNLAEVQIERKESVRLVGNIYKGKVANVLPGMQAAFIDIGLERNAFLYAGDILADKSDFIFENTQEVAQIHNISKLLTVGQDILVQVLKQPGGSKGARVTTHITLSGRNLVLMPTIDHIGVSRKIENENERERLKNEISSVLKPGTGAIIRTVGEGLDAKAFVSEIELLQKLWDRVNQRFVSLRAPQLLHSEESLIFRVVRDMLDDNVERFVINDLEAYERILAAARIIAPQFENKIEYFNEHYDIFTYFNIASKADTIVSKKVWLKCGGYLVFDEAEALTVVDVNTGKYVGDRDLQGTILDVNLQAAQEIAKQLRLRDVSGIIIIDFIDMEILENREKVLECLKDALKGDSTKTNVIGLTGLGLVEMTRKKVHRNISMLTKCECPMCHGLGHIDSSESTALKIRREIIRQVNETNFEEFIIYVSSKTAEFFSSRADYCEEIRSVKQSRHFFLKVKDCYAPYEFQIVGVNDSKLHEEMKNSIFEL